MTNVSHYYNKSFKLTFLILVVLSASFLVLSALRRQSSRLLHRNIIPQQTYQEPECSYSILGTSEQPTNISHVLFGISGSVHTWPDRRHYSEIWWQPNITRGFVWLDEQPDPKLFTHPNSLPFKISEKISGSKKPGSNPNPDPNRNPAVRIARIVLESFNLGLPDVRWFVMGDDDTVFFADNLVSVLSKYDHRKMYYVGASSESVEQDVMHSYDMAFGGGGFAVSYPLAKELARVLDGCLDRYRYVYGSDERVCACVSELGVGLTKERGFHQMDIRGDAYGLLAAHPMTPLISLHHLDYINPLIPNLTKYESLDTLIQTYRLDPPRTMQQSFCYHNTRSISVSWGYTVQIYPTLLRVQELAMPLQTFFTWSSFKDGPFTFNTRPMSTNSCERPSIYYISRVQEAENVTMTTYTRDKSVDICKNKHYPYKIKKVVVLASKMNSNYWMQGPRRQCCEIVRWKYNSVKIRVRNCKYGETITA